MGLWPVLTKRVVRLAAFSLGLGLSCATARAGTAVVDHGDGTYSRVRTDDVVPGDRAVDGVLTWEYIGQVRHSWEPTPASERWVETSDREVERSMRSQLIGANRYDAQGGEWRVVDVDEAALDEVVDAHDGRCTTILG